MSKYRGPPRQARSLRKAGNLSEILLWNQLKNKKFLALDFDRQKQYVGSIVIPSKQFVSPVGQRHLNYKQ